MVQLTFPLQAALCELNFDYYNFTDAKAVT